MKEKMLTKLERDRAVGKVLYTMTFMLHLIPNIIYIIIIYYNNQAKCLSLSSMYNSCEITVP